MQALKINQFLCITNFAWHACVICNSKVSLMLIYLELQYLNLDLNNSPRISTALSTFTFMHLADVCIQSKLHWRHMKVAVHGNPTHHNHGVASMSCVVTSKLRWLRSPTLFPHTKLKLLVRACQAGRNALERAAVLQFSEKHLYKLLS